MENQKIQIETEIDYTVWKAKIKSFVDYFEGLTRHNTTSQRKLLNLLSDIEKMVFGEVKTGSWG